MERSAPFVTVIIPCRNEGPFIAGCLDSVLASEYPRDRLEVLVVDGMSEDGTPGILRAYAARDARVRVLSNPRHITPVAMNLGIREARGKVLVRMDAHATYPPDYLTRCVTALLESGADNVGGVMHTVPRTAGRLAAGIAAVTSHWFGVGGSRFRVHPARPVWVDTVFGGCYRREVFERLGLFNEKLARGQDMEFNRRLRLAGGRILLHPAIRCEYYTRSTLREFWRHTWTDGVWAIVPFLHSPVRPVSWRHLVPLAFVVALRTSGVLAALTHAGGWLLGAMALVYGIGTLVAAGQVAVRKRDPLLGLMILPLFATLHLAYGLGSLQGTLQVARRVLAGARRPSAAPAWPRLTPITPTGLVRPLPAVSVVIPARNEAGLIGACITSILASNYPADRVEVLVIDGMSEDDTAAIARSHAARDARVRVLSNPRRIIPAAMNLGIRKARGEVLVRMDAHATYPPDYLTRCVTALLESGADNVGGVMHTVPRTAGRLAAAIAAVTSHWFGVGGSWFRVHPARPVWVDTVFGGCYRREVFERLGLFNEKLARGEDMEFNRRLRLAGGRILLHPGIRCDYFARSSLSEFWRHTWVNGIWAVVPFLYSPVRPVSWRHLVPLASVMALGVLGILAVLGGLGRSLLLGMVSLYGIGALVAAAQVAGSKRDPFLLFTMPPLFVMLHLVYGLGSLRGMFYLAGRLLSGARRPSAAQAWPRTAPALAGSQGPAFAP